MQIVVAIAREKRVASRVRERSLTKRIFDLLVSSVGVLLLSPVFILVAILVRFKLGTPVLFLQQRPGRHGAPFKMIKFRSMTNERDENGNLLSNEKRMTSFGRFLRSTSFDELPELFNVIAGDMSLVGPRPLLMEYLPYFTDEQQTRHDVRPGITGWAQVNGRNAISWDEKLDFDLWYVRNQTFWLDMKILYQTLLKVVKRDDINHSDQVSMPRFDEYMKMKQLDNK